VALYRALETSEPRRPPLFCDPFALRFLPWRLRLLVQVARGRRSRRALLAYADRRAPGARTSAIARTLFIDDVVRTARRRGVAQLVLLGAGFDCRAHRLPELEQTDVFEVDRGPTQGYKRSRLADSHVRYVAVDFLRDDAFERLAAAGWQRARASLFVWEGVTNYLSEEAVMRVLREVGRCAVGSAIVFTYVHRGVIDGSVRFAGDEIIVGNVRALGEPWTFGLEPASVAGFVQRAGLTLREDYGADDYRARYLPPGELDVGYAFYRIAVAERAAG
jgi:methyltransferase (TIGR00027 family)